jgi:3'-phosphoadenosine 5'-phosphosulfate sulfotransferase (PAPS reductase)/FAD synthetase
MKKKPAKKYAHETGRKPMTGQMAHESVSRENLWMQYGCNGFDMKEPISNPMAFWTEQDVLHYIKKFNVPYCPVYGDIHVKPPSDAEEGQINVIDYLGCYEPEDTLETTGCNRTGCIFCMFGCHLEKEPNRFQRLKETHPRQYAYCINGGEMVDGKWQPSKEGLGLGKVLDYIGVKYD